MMIYHSENEVTSFCYRDNQLTKLFIWNYLWSLSSCIVELVGESAGPGLTVSLGSFTSQQLACSLWLEVAAGDVLTVTTVQHFLVPVLFHLLKTQGLGSVIVFQCMCVWVSKRWCMEHKHTINGSPASAAEPLRAESFGATAMREKESKMIFKGKNP